MKQKLFKTLTLGTAALSTAACGQAQKVQEREPNVIIIYADDVGFGDLSCNGSTTISTPNVERLAASGVRFTNAHTTSATSTPSRFGLLTGIYPWRIEGTGIATGHAAMIVKPEHYTIADAMKSAGYTTGVVGKWHLGLGDKTGEQNWNGKITPGPEDIGFDYSFIMAATGDRVPCVYYENQQAVGLDPSDPIEVSYDKPFPGEPTGKNNPELLKLHPSHGHDQAIVNGISRIGYMKGGKSALWVDEEIADRITDKALEFIATNKDKPFFLYFGTNDIHVPRAPHSRFVGKSGMGARGDAILEFDYTVGAVLDKLEELGIRENTIVILSSDNGPVVDDGYADKAVELLGEHKPWGSMRGGKYSAYEAGTRVPMIVSWGSKTKPMVSDAPFSHIDIFASLANLAGVEIPSDAAYDSRNALSVLLGEDLNGRSQIVEQNVQNTLSIVVDNWKYIEPSDKAPYGKFTNTEYGNNPKPQLYNLKDDIGEKNNLAEGNPDKVKELQQALDKVIADGGRVVTAKKKN